MKEEYPKALYNRKKEVVLIKNETEHAALEGDHWESPADVGNKKTSEKPKPPEEEVKVAKGKE